MNNKTFTVMLGENDIEEIINGRTVTVELPEGNKVIVQQSLFKDIALPLINNPNRVVDVHQEAIKQAFLSDMRSDLFRPGC